MLIDASGARNLMYLVTSRPRTRRLLAAGFAIAAAGLLASCSGGEVPPHLRPLSKDAMHLLGKKGMDPRAPILVRIFKEESELEVWKARSDGRFYHFRTYPICNWSGGLGPKIRQGDKQSPEGFYQVTRAQLNPKSKYHLSYNLGYPNALDRAYGRTGDFLMVHGDCRSAGCYAMTDALVEELYALAREAFNGGQKAFQVHAFPFRMTEENMRRHRRSKWYPFWRQLKEGYDAFEKTRLPVKVAVCERRYLINVRFLNGGPVDPSGPCPAYERETPRLWAGDVPAVTASVEDGSIIPGPKLRTAENGRLRPYRRPSTGFGLLRIPRGLSGLGGPRPSIARGLGFSD